MRTTWKMSLALMSMLMLAGLTGCEKAEKAVSDVTESAKQTAEKAVSDAKDSAKQTVETTKNKAIEMLGGTEKNETKGQPTQEKEEEGEGEKKK